MNNKDPESLIEKLIKNHYSGDGIVFDPCCGSGVVGRVCKKLGIPYLLMDVDDTYLEV